MVHRSSFYYDTTTTHCEKIWDPNEVLEIINPIKGRITCAGHAPSQGRRCWNPSNVSKRAQINTVVDEIAYLQPDNPTVISRLRSIAGSALCYLHQGQSEDVVSQWQRKIKRATPAPRSTKREPRIKKEPSIDDMDDLLEQMRVLKERIARMKGLECVERVSASKQHLKQEQEEKEWKNMKKAEKIRLEQERLEKERLEKERLEKERLEKERLEKERVERERREAEKREQERREKEDRERERKAQNERIRQRAQKRREENERKEREAWEQAGQRYQTEWTAFKLSTSSKNNKKDIPWPVKSGLIDDIDLKDAKNVREFLHKAVLKGGNMAKLLRRESLKWHPDRRHQTFLGREMTDDEVDAIDAIVRLISNMLDECSTE